MAIIDPLGTPTGAPWNRLVTIFAHISAHAYKSGSTFRVRHAVAFTRTQEIINFILPTVRIGTNRLCFVLEIINIILPTIRIGIVRHCCSILASSSCDHELTSGRNITIVHSEYWHTTATRNRFHPGSQQAIRSSRTVPITVTISLTNSQ